MTDLDLATALSITLAQVADLSAAHPGRTNSELLEMVSASAAASGICLDVEVAVFLPEYSV